MNCFKQRLLVFRAQQEQAMSFDSTCPPFLTTQSSALLSLARTARLTKSGCCRNSSNVSVSHWRNTSICYGRGEKNGKYFVLLVSPQKKSHGVKRGVAIQCKTMKICCSVVYCTILVQGPKIFCAQEQYEYLRILRVSLFDTLCSSYTTVLWFCGPRENRAWRAIFIRHLF